MKEKRIGAIDIVLLILSAALLIGVLTVFAPCGPKEDGSWMTCHWAGNAAAGVAAVLTVCAIVRMLVKRTRPGMDCAMAASAILAALLPGELIHLCMMADMRCRAVMTPAVRVLSVLIAVVAVIDIVLQRRKAEP